MAEKVAHTAERRGNAFISGWSEAVNLRECKGML